jgi:hypothetical protein
MGSMWDGLNHHHGPNLQCKGPLLTFEPASYDVGSHLKHAMQEGILRMQPGLRPVVDALGKPEDNTSRMAYPFHRVCCSSKEYLRYLPLMHYQIPSYLWRKQSCLKPPTSDTQVCLRPFLGSATDPLYCLLFQKCLTNSNDKATESALWVPAD